MPLDHHILLLIFNIIFIDIILGGDNAVVIALACRRLPEKKRNRAIIIGTGLAVILRIGLTAMIASLLHVPYLLFTGGVFLIFIALKLMTSHDEKINVRAGASLFSAVRTIVFADLVMGLDNMLAVAGASKGHIELIAAGLLISVPIIVWGSKIILVAMERFPFLIYAGGGVLVYTASEMITGEPKLHHFFASGNGLINVAPIMIIFVLGLGWMINFVSAHGFSKR